MPLVSPTGFHHPIDQDHLERGRGTAALYQQVSNARAEQSLSRLWVMKQKSKEKKLEQLKQIHKKETHLLNQQNLKRRYQLYPSLNKLEPNEYLKFEYSSTPGKPMLHVEEHRLYNDPIPRFEPMNLLLDDPVAQREQKPKCRGKERLPGAGEKRSVGSRKEKSKTAILSEFKIAVRSATPTVEDLVSAETKGAALLIQTTIKGRSDQIKMQRGRKLKDEALKRLLENGPPPRANNTPKDDNDNVDGEIDESSGKFDISEEKEALRKSRDDDLYQFFR